MAAAALYMTTVRLDFPPVVHSLAFLQAAQWSTVEMAVSDGGRLAGVVHWERNNLAWRDADGGGT